MGKSKKVIYLYISVVPLENLQGTSLSYFDTGWMDGAGRIHTMKRSGIRAWVNAHESE
jgi:hypothetical protein